MATFHLSLHKKYDQNVGDVWMILIKNGHKYLVKVFSGDGTRAIMALLLL